MNGISSHIATKLESLGITVKGERIFDNVNFDSNSSGSDDSEAEEMLIDKLSNPNVSDLSTKNIANIPKVNLDVSAMLAYCSSVTNGSASLYDFNVPVLKQQAEWERLRPQKPILDHFFMGKKFSVHLLLHFLQCYNFLGKKLYCCQTAKENFVNIVDTVGGPNEKVRSEDLLERLTVLPDDANSKNAMEDHDFREIFGKVQYTDEKSLKVGGKIKKRSFIVFTFGDRIQAVTVTANDGFVRAAKQQVRRRLNKLFAVGYSYLF